VASERKPRCVLISHTKLTPQLDTLLFAPTFFFKELLLVIQNGSITVVLLPLKTKNKQTETMKYMLHKNL
jgi:hypothetical protein